MTLAMRVRLRHNFFPELVFYYRFWDEARDAMKLKVGDRFVCAVEKVAYKGKAIARINGFVCFVTGGVPGDVVEVEITRKKRSYCEGTVVSVLEPSADRKTPRCRHFGSCGGCKWQHLAYPAQLRWKTENVREAFEHLSHLSYGELRDTLPSPRLWQYRNKMDFSFAPDPSGRTIVAGLHQAGRFDAVVNLTECWLPSPRSVAMLAQVRSKAQELGVTAYSIRTHTGFLRNLVVRTVKASEQIMILLVTSPPEHKADLLLLDWFFHDFATQFQSEDSLLHIVAENRAQVAMGRIERCEGPGYLEEVLNGLRFRISPFAFFQPNPYQAEQLFTVALEFAQLRPTDIVWDLYCGTGSITLHAARQAYHVFGVELVESAIADAQQNAQLNRLENLTFYAVDLHAAEGRHLLQSLPKPDVVILDPPRAGIHRRVIASLLEVLPQRIVYVSCNPTTQARDCGLLSDHYRIAVIQPVDMFPHTYHIESVVLLERKANNGNKDGDGEGEADTQNH